MSGDGRKLWHTAGRSGLPKIMQRLASSNCRQRTPAGLPFGMPGMGEEMDGAMQQAPQPKRQEKSVMASDDIRVAKIVFPILDACQLSFYITDWLVS
jgi:hypothetical protein